MSGAGRSSFADEFEFTEADKRELANQTRMLEEKLINSALHWREISSPWPSFLSDTLERFRPEILHRIDQKISLLSYALTEHPSDKILLQKHGKAILDEIEKLLNPATHEPKKGVQLNSIWVKPLADLYIALKDYQEICELSALLASKEDAKKDRMHRRFRP